MRLGQTSLIYFVAKIIGSALGFLATIYFARVLGEVVLGYYALALALVSWLALGGRIGLSQAITKRISEETESESYATAGVLLIGTFGLIMAVGVYLFRGHVEAYIGQPVAVLVILMLFASLFKGFINAALKGYHFVHIYAILSTTKIGLRSLIQVALVVVGYSLVGLLVGYVAGAVIVGFIGLAVLQFRPTRPRKEHFKSLFDFAKFSWLGSIRHRAFNEVDIVVLGFFVQTGLIGVYSVAWALSKFLDIFGESVSNTLFPEMSKIATAEDRKAVSGLTEDALAFAGLIAIPGFVGGTVLADRLMAIYGEGFVVGQVVLPILIGALLIYAFTRQFLNTLNAIDRPDLAFRANGAFILSNVTLNVLLIWRYGWVGAAVATAVSAAIGLVVAYYYLRPQVPFEVPLGEIGRQWIAAIGMGAVVYAARRLGETHPAAETLVAYNAAFVVVLVGIGAAVYFLLLLAISGQFRRTVDDNLPIGVPKNSGRG
ncbi:polysaccharide biosynthesis protein [Halalkaliarchaeum desulfuricum]|uniref:Polysaccharide biosynthesis protein n=1 Tax=Halalkaliarchaeum desulfuricum TaxID=2055893 RepID=A0A343TN60_9EURY|nr:polysaccharide biosynthesis C-terminal domain-containing protein [Halalkaliarchaeum desulfuricum]AUX10532.1 polysaccharide biosynthesis protein [Halalkaliarchaeum desulfuricum]